MKILVVGAGFTGASAARLLAEDGNTVTVIDRRLELGGNAADRVFDGKLSIHGPISLYGPHLFHTNSSRIFQFLSRFTEWRKYEHKVVSMVDGELVPMPITFGTLNKLFGTAILTEDRMRSLLEGLREPQVEINTSYDRLLDTVGSYIASKLFLGYTEKQWGLAAWDLDSSVVARIPIRYNDDQRYFTDIYQAMPIQGYSEMFRNMLTHTNIRYRTQEFAYGMVNDYDHVVYTGQIDQFYSYRFGELPYRSVNFTIKSAAYTEDELDVKYSRYATVNFPDIDKPFTRITNFSAVNGLETDMPILCSEFPHDKGEPYYPIPTKENHELYQKYLEHHDPSSNVHFCGRLGSYRYLNMDQACAQGLKVARTIMGQDDADL